MITVAIHHVFSKLNCPRVKGVKSKWAFVNEVIRCYPQVK